MCSNQQREAQILGISDLKITRACLALVCIAATPHLAHAGVQQIGGPTGLTAAVTPVTITDATPVSPVDLTGPQTLGVNVNTLTITDQTDLFEIDQAGHSYVGTAFADGTNIIAAGGFQGAGGQIMLSFANAVATIGFNAEEFNDGAYTITVSAYDGTTLLGIFTASGSDPDGGYASNLSYIGLQATGTDVMTSLTISDDEGGDIAFGTS